MDYDQTEIASCYEKARALAPETARLWLDLLSVWVDRGALLVIVDLSSLSNPATERSRFPARLSDKDFEQGMAALRSAVDGIDRNAAVTEEIDGFVFRRCG
jgi:hypothetical protein